MERSNSVRRAVVQGLLCTTAVGFASRSIAAYSGRSKAFDAVLSKEPLPAGGPPNFRTLREALAAAPDASTQPYRIHVPTGTWREHNFITKPNIHLVGDGQTASIIVYDDRAHAQRPENEPAATLVVKAPDFRAEHLMIANDFDYPNNMPAEVPYDRTGASGSQATAVFLTTGSDRAVFDNVAITGWQDTLYTDVARSYFRHCLISGCVDFIYGEGIVVFDRCEILSRTRPGKDFHGFIAAPDTNRTQRFGLIFLDCQLKKDHDMLAHTVALGRPWRHTMNFPDGRYGNPDAIPQAAFLRCWMDDHIVPEAWYPMHYNNREGQRVMYQPEDARLFEYKSHGPGAGSPSARRRQLSDREARDYRPEIILDGWDPGKRRFR